jgi:hypothetical protein
LKTRRPSSTIELEVNDVSDRRQLGDLMPDLADEAVWKTVVSRVRAKGDERFQVERDEMRRLGILNAREESTSVEWPADMKLGSRTDVAT